MEPRVHYFTFKNSDSWVEVLATTNRKAEAHIKQIYGLWTHHYNEYNFAWVSRKYPGGCIARYEVD
jgi:adenine-specific DNA methylase